MKKELSLTPKSFAALSTPTGNTYEATVIIAKRAKQLATKTKREIDERLVEFMVPGESLEEVFQNDEQISIAKSYEKRPKPTITAAKEFLDGELAYRYIDAESN